eukprot:UN00599
MGNKVNSNLKSELVYPTRNVSVPHRYISMIITNYILNEMKSTERINENIPKELGRECLKYVGFLMYSVILTNKEQFSLLDLMAPLFPKCEPNQVLRYCNLLYRSSVEGTGKYCNRRLLSQIRYKSKIIIIYKTDFGHVFGIYLESPDYKLEAKLLAQHTKK